MSTLQITRADLRPESRAKAASTITGEDLPWTPAQLEATRIELIDDDGKVYCIKNRLGKLP